MVYSSFEETEITVDDELIGTLTFERIFSTPAEEEEGAEDMTDQEPAEETEDMDQEPEEDTAEDTDQALTEEESGEAAAESAEGEE